MPHDYRLRVTAPPPALLVDAGLACLHGEGWPQAEQQLATWRGAGERIVTTNGCFDGIHGGHVALLSAAKAAGHRLVVGLNDDASTRALKGADRPQHAASNRAATLAALRSVDLVVIYSELLPHDFLAAVRPNVHVKGGDYAVDRLPEAGLVHSWGGEVQIVPLVAGASTTGARISFGADTEMEQVLLDVLGAATCVRQTAFALASPIVTLADHIARQLKFGNTVLACGNGGSAADADHLVAELVGRFGVVRPALAARSLCGDAATLTALANDFGYAEVFARQVEGCGRQGDVLFAISTSGGSPNVVRAAEVARARGIYVVALLGAGPGPLTALADCVLSVPAHDVAWIQQGHRAVLHALCRRIDARMAPP